MLYSIVGIIVVILDQLVKLWVDNNIHSFEEIRQLIPGVVSLVRVQNDGAAFSFLSGGGARVWFILITAVFAILVVIALATNFISGRFGRWCLVFVTAGGLSNMIDRVRYGYVLDMFKVDLFNFAVFNVADIFITVFCIAFIIYILFGGEKELEDDADVFDERDYESEDRPRREKPKSKSRYPKEYDYSDEDEAPVRRRSRPRDEEDEDVPVRRSREPKPVNASSGRSAKQTDMFNEMFGTEAPAQRSAQKPSRPQSQQRERIQRPPQRPAPAQRPAPTPAARAYDSSDPFAEWEMANARAKTDLETGRTAQAMGASKQRSPEISTFEAPVKRKPVEPAFSDDLDLDAILNEFK